MLKNISPHEKSFAELEAQNPRRNFGKTMASALRMLMITMTTDRHHGEIVGANMICEKENAKLNLLSLSAYMPSKRACSYTCFLAVACEQNWT